MVRPSVTPCGVNISVERTINTLPGIFPSVVKKVINYGVARSNKKPNKYRIVMSAAVIPRWLTRTASRRREERERVASCGGWQDGPLLMPLEL